MGSSRLGTVALLLFGCSGDRGPQRFVLDAVDVSWVGVLGAQEGSTGILAWPSSEAIRIDASSSDELVVLGWSASTLSRVFPPGPSELRAGRLRSARSTESALPLADVELEARGETLEERAARTRVTASWCRELTACDVSLVIERPLTLTSTVHHADFVVRSGPTTALVGAAGNTFEVDASGNVREVPELRGYRFATADYGGGHVVWLADLNGTVARYEPKSGLDLGFPRYTSGPAVRDVGLAAAPDGEPVELFVVTSTGTIARFDGARWSTEHRIATPDHEATRLLRFGPRHVIALDRTGLNVIEVDRGVATVTRLEREPRTIVFVPELGPLIGAGVGKIYVRRDVGRWDTLERIGSITDPIRTLVTTARGGFFAGGNEGGLTWYAPEHGSCAGRVFGNGRILVDGVQLGEVTLIVQNATPAPPLLTLLELAPITGACVR